MLRRHAADIEGSRAWGEFSTVSAMWAAQLPADGEQLFAWLLQLPESDVLELVTFCLAASLNMQARRGNDHTGAALAAALGLNMADWWTSTAEGYLKHILKAQVLAAVSNARSADAASSMAKLKKPDLIVAAEGALAGTGWLPELFKTTS